jgi:hypothetical protein
VRFPSEFVSAEMISLIVRNGRGRVGMGSKVVQFGDSIVRARWHDIPLAESILNGIKVGKIAKLLRTS